MSRRSYFQTLPRDVVKLGIPYLPIGRLIILWLNGDIDRSVIEENVQIFSSRIERFGLPEPLPPRYGRHFSEYLIRYPRNVPEYFSQLEIAWRYLGADSDDDEYQSLKEVTKYVLYRWKEMEAPKIEIFEEEVYLVDPNSLINTIRVMYVAPDFIENLQGLGFSGRSFLEAFLKILDILERNFRPVADKLLLELTFSSTLIPAWEKSSTREEFLTFYINSLREVLESGSFSPNEPKFIFKLRKVI